MAPYCLLWSQLVSFGPIWSYLVLFGPIWSYLVLFSPICTYLDQSRTICTYLHLLGPIWTHLNQFRPILTYFYPVWPIGTPRDLFGLFCTYLDLCGPLWKLDSLCRILLVSNVVSQWYEAKDSSVKVIDWNWAWQYLIFHYLTRHVPNIWWSKRGAVMTVFMAKITLLGNIEMYGILYIGKKIRRYDGDFELMN